MIKNIITILILLCTSAYAQKSVLNNDSIKIKKILEEVVITGQIKEVNIDNALHDINIISLETIKKGGFTSLNEILKFQSNIQISNDNILGITNKYSRSYRRKYQNTNRWKTNDW